MDMIGGELGFMAASAAKAFLTLMEPHRLMFLGLGCIMGLVLGIIPGIGGLTGTAMLLPFTFNMDPYSAFALLLGLGATTATGDPIPAVLFDVPGGAASAATVLDGFPMAKKGEAGRALSAAYMSSLMGGVFGALPVAISIPIPGRVMLLSGWPELLAFSVLGISMVAVLSGNAPLRGITAGCLGVMIAMIGTDPQTGTLRWTFDSLYLWDGLPLTPLLLGVFALPELCDLLIARVAISADTGTANISKGQGQGGTGVLEGLGGDHAMLVDRRRHRLHSRHQRVRRRLARLRPCAQDREGRQRDIRQGRRAGRDRIGELQQRQGGRSARSHRRLRRSRQRHHGDPAWCVPDPRSGAGPRHADQESQHHLRDGVVGSVGQYVGWGSVFRVQPEIRQARDAALHAHPAGCARHHLYRRVRGHAPMGRSLYLAFFWFSRLAHEAVQMAAPAAHSR